MWPAKNVSPKFPVTIVPRCTGSNEKTVEFKHMHFSDMGASGGPPNGERVVHHRSDELLIQQNPVSDGQKTHPV
jgi:hypothetical protein